MVQTNRDRQTDVRRHAKTYTEAWADPGGGGGTGGPDPPHPLEFWQKCAYRIREMVLV